MKRLVEAEILLILVYLARLCAFTNRLNSLTEIEPFLFTSIVLNIFTKSSWPRDTATPS